MPRPGRSRSMHARSAPGTTLRTVEGLRGAPEVVTAIDSCHVGSMDSEHADGSDAMTPSLFGNPADSDEPNPGESEESFSAAIAQAVADAPPDGIRRSILAM